MKAVFFIPANHDQGFDQIMSLRSMEMIATLEEMGISVFPLSVQEEKAIEMIQAFDPDFMIAANFNYFLLAISHNLLNWTKKPIVALWDDPLGALAYYINHWKPQFSKAVNVTQTTSALEMFRQIMSHPQVIHFSWDHGHIETMRSLNLVSPEKVQWYPIATFSPFLNFGKNTQVTPTVDVAYSGNIYLYYMRRHRLWRKWRLRSLTKRICQRKLLSLSQSLFDLMRHEIDDLSERTRDKYNLRIDEKEFWDFYLFVVWHAGNAMPRLEILSKVQRTVLLYGLFNDLKSVKLLNKYPNLTYGGHLHHFDELPRGYATTKVNLCIANGLIHKGVPSKLIDCLASGGFALSDPKDDLVHLFGEDIRQIFFENTDQLNQKIDYYLSHPAQRTMILKELQYVIEQKCTLKGLFERVLSAVQNTCAKNQSMEQFLHV